MQRASDLINHLQDLIDKHWNLELVWIWFDSDDWCYDIDEFIFSKEEVVKDKEWYRYPYPFREESINEVFLISL